MGTRDKRLKDEEDSYEMKFDTIITPLDESGMPLTINKGKNNLKFNIPCTFHRLQLLLIRNLKIENKKRLLPIEDKENNLKDSNEENTASPSGAADSSIVSSSTVKITCNKGDLLCSQNVFLIYPQIDYAQFKLEIDLKTNESSSWFESFTFEFIMMNSKYTLMIMGLKFVFFLISVILGIVYIRFYRKMNSFIKTFEHRMIYALSIMLMIFNDPLTVLEVFKPSMFFLVLESFSISIFVTALIVFWIVMIQRIHSEATTPETKLIKNKLTIFLGNTLFCYHIELFKLFVEDFSQIIRISL